MFPWLLFIFTFPSFFFSRVYFFLGLYFEVVYASRFDTIYVLLVGLKGFNQSPSTLP